MKLYMYFLLISSCRWLPCWTAIAYGCSANVSPTSVRLQLRDTSYRICAASWINANFPSSWSITCVRQSIFGLFSIKCLCFVKEVHTAYCITGMYKEGNFLRHNEDIVHTSSHWIIILLCYWQIPATHKFQLLYLLVLFSSLFYRTKYIVHFS